MNEESLFAEALKRTDPAERAAFLEQACCNDAELRRRVEALLLSHEQAGSFLNKVDAGPTGDEVPGQWLEPDELPETPLEGVGSRIKQYKLLQQIGEGGMGVVFMAEQQEPVRRMVALKVIKAGMDSAQVIARFEQERQALALMDHPNIAKVLDAGTTNSGRPFFVMELVKGIPMTKYCDEQRLSPKQRLELFVPVCQAIQHAHQKGIIHRDIKPSNVLIAAYDGKPVPKVIDFGVAKATGGKLTERTLFTGFGGLVGTLEYMSPEQAEFNALDIDTRSDIYGLGVLLYELLTGSTPLTRPRLKEVALTEALRLIREEEPPRPSTRLSESKESLASVSAQRHSELAALVKSLRGEVDWIVMKALEKDRTRRYETANSLARDIQRYLAEEPVEAGPPSARYRLRKLAWKHRRGLATAAALLLLLVAGVVTSTGLAMWALREERLANQRLDETTAQKERAEQAEMQVREQLEAVEQQKERAEKAETQAKGNEAKARQEEAKSKQSEADTQAVLDYFQNKVLSAGRPKGQAGGLGKDVKLIDAVNAAEPFLASAFNDRPFVEGKIRNALGITYDYLGELESAIRQHERALALCKNKRGDEHPDTLTGMSNLASAYRIARRFDEARLLFERLLRLNKAALGEEHPRTLDCMNRLACVYLSSGRRKEATPLFETALRLRKATLGEDHPDTLESMSDLAACYWFARQLDRSEPLYEETLRLRQAKLGVDHPNTLLTMVNLAINCRDAGRIQDAIVLLQDAFRRAAQRPDGFPSSWALSSEVLSQIYDGAGQFAKSEAIRRTVLELTRKQFGADSLPTAGAMAALGANLLLQRKYADAEPLLRDCLSIRQAKQPDDWVAFNAQSLLGEALLGQKKYADAEPLLLQGYQGMKQREAKIPPRSKARLREALKRLVQLCEATGKKDEAAKWWKQLEHANADAKTQKRPSEKKSSTR